MILNFNNFGNSKLKYKELISYYYVRISKFVGPFKLAGNTLYSEENVAAENSFGDWGYFVLSSDDTK